MEFRLRRVAQIALGAAAIVAAALAVGALPSGRPEWRVASASAPASQPAPAVWEDAPGAAPRFRLTDPTFGREPEFYSVRRNVAGGGRLDQLAFGSPARDAPFLRLTFYRPFDEPVGGVSFWLEMARRAGEAGLSLERAPPVPETFATRIGEFEFGALSALGPDGPRACIGFRREQRSPDFVISGLACAGGEGSGAHIRQALVCALDSVVLTGAVDDPELDALFASPEKPECRRAPPASG